MKEYIVLSTDDTSKTSDGAYIFRLLRPLKNVKSLRLVYAALPKTGRFLCTDVNLRVAGAGLNTAQKATAVEKNENTDPTFNFLGRLQFQDISTGSFIDSVVKEGLKWGTVPQFVFENASMDYMKYIFKPTLAALSQIRIRFDNEFAPFERQYIPNIYVFSTGAEQIDDGRVETEDEILYKVKNLIEDNNNTKITRTSVDTPRNVYTGTNFITNYTTLPLHFRLRLDMFYAHQYTNERRNEGVDYFTVGQMSSLSSNTALLNAMTNHLSNIYSYATSKSPYSLCEITDSIAYTIDDLKTYNSPILFTTNRLSNEVLQYIKTFNIFTGNKLLKYGWVVVDDFSNDNCLWGPMTSFSPSKEQVQVSAELGGTIQSYASYAFDYSRYYSDTQIYLEPPPAPYDPDSVENAWIQTVQHRSGGRCIFVPGDTLSNLLSTLGGNGARFAFLALLLKTTRLRSKSTQVKGSVNLEKYDFYTVERMFLPDHMDLEGNRPTPSSLRTAIGFSDVFFMAIELSRELSPIGVYSSSNMNVSDISSTDVDITFADTFYNFEGSEFGSEQQFIDSFSELSAPISITIEADIEDPACFLGICSN